MEKDDGLIMDVGATRRVARTGGFTPPALGVGVVGIWE